MYFYSYIIISSKYLEIYSSSSSNSNSSNKNSRNYKKKEGKIIEKDRYKKLLKKKERMIKKCRIREK